jgi:cyanophycinase
MRPRTILFFILCCALPAMVIADGYTTWLSGPDTDVEASWSNGLLLAGGGGDVDTAMRWLLNKAPGGNLVVLRASGADGYNNYLFDELGVPMHSVRTILFHSKEAAQDPDVLRWIQQAEVIFIAGGDQSRYVDFWSATPVQDALQQHLLKRKPLGGTSAGLAVIGSHAYSAAHRGDLTSKIALAYPNHRYFTFVSGFLPSPLLPHVLTDSHFTERARLARLIVMLAHLQQAQAPVIMGIGVDERTALCIDGNGDAQVLSDDEGTVSLILLDPPGPDFAAKRPATGLVADVILLGTGSSLNTIRRSVDAPLDVARILVDNGRLGKP